MRSVSLAAIRSRNSFNHIIFALLRSQLQVGKFHRLLTESFSERRVSVACINQAINIQNEMPNPSGI